MSGKLSGAVWEIELSGSKQQVMLALADHGHDDGTKCYPGVPYLAWKTGYSERHVKRLLRELEEDELIVPVAYEKGGRGHATEYEMHLEKGDKKPPYVKGDKSERVTTRHKKGDAPTQKGDTTGLKGDTPAPKGDITVSPQPLEPLEPSIEPSGEESARETPLPDDATSQCLLLLKRVKGIGRNYGELAVLLAELREEFPAVDPVGVCKEYELYHRKPPKPTRNHALKLRNFFANRDKWQSEEVEKNGKPPPASASEKKDYSWWTNR